MALSITATRGPPRISARNAKFATVIVGEESVSFVVHEELLTYHSPFFRAALNGNFEEATTKTVLLKEVRTDVFEFFVHWLYHQRLPNKNDDPELLAAWRSIDDCGALKAVNLIYLHVFCDKYDVPTLKRLSLDHLFKHFADTKTSLPSDRNVLYAFENISADSPLCRLLVDFSCDHADETAWDSIGEQCWEDTCGGFDQEVVRIFFKKLLQRYTKFAHGYRSSTSKLALCDYHEHNNAEDRKACTAKRRT